MLSQLIMDFAYYLRKNGLDVSTASIYEVNQAIPYMNIHSRADFQFTLKQLWIKDKSDFEKFDKAFHQYFYIDIKDKISAVSLRNQIQEVQHSIENMHERFKRRAMTPEEAEFFVLRMLKDQSETKTTELFKKMVQRAPDMKEICHTLEGVDKDTIDSVAEELTWDAITHDYPAVVFDAINRIRQELLNLKKEVFKIKSKAQQALSHHEKTVHKGLRKMITTTADDLMDVPISKLKKADAELLKETIERSSLPLLTKFSKLMKAVNKENELDMKKVMSESMRTFGIPIQLYYKSFKKKKTKIDILLDGSGSVKKYSEFLTLFAYLIHKQFPGQVRVFTFVGLLDETTRFLNDSDIDVSIQSVLRKGEVDYRGYSDYGKALSIYQENHMNQVDKDTIVFILGDARNNKNLSNEHILQQLHSSTHGVFWFNPEEIKKWGKGDSRIKLYQPFLSAIYETTTLRKLTDALHDIVTISCEKVVNSI